MGKRLPLITLATALVLVGCDEDPTSPEEDGLETLRQATEAYQDVDVAMQDDFIPVAGCEDPPDFAGALGIPYLDPNRLDTNIDLENPEILFYEPQENGDLELVGVEIIVPIDDWEEQYEELPSVLGQEFHRNEAEGLFGIHIWIWRDHPEDVFGFANPNVSCEYADAEE